MVDRCSVLCDEMWEWHVAWKYLTFLAAAFGATEIGAMEFLSLF